MRYLSKHAVLSTLVLIVAAFLGCSSSSSNDGQDVTILFTHDMHSYFLPHNETSSAGEVASWGGYANIMTVIDAKKRAAGADATLVVDAGDLAMGTLFHTLYATQAPELELMGRLGYDAVCFGNHDFDFGPTAIGMMLTVAKAKTGITLPQILSSNIDFTDAQQYKAPFDAYPVKPYTTIEKNGLKIGLFGMMDLRAALESPFAAPIRFSLNPNDPTDTAKVYQTAQSMVNTLRNVENCDIVICLSHAGTNADDSKSEDAGLAYNVQGIDVIISGHTHTVLSEPKIVSYKDSTSFSIICSAGAYCNYLGNLHIRKGASGVTVVSYRLTPINPTVARDENIYSRILEFKAMASAGYLQLFGGIGFDDVVAKAPFTFDNIEDFWNNPKPSSLGDIVADSFDYAIRVAEGSTYNTINAAAQADGIVRNTVNMGNMTVEDTFQVLSMGISPCPYIPVPPYNINTPGLPLMAFYLYGAELKTVLEINTTIAPAFTAANMYISRAKCTWDSTRPAFDRITSLQVTNALGQLEDYNPTTLYRVAADYYAMVMMVQLLSTYGITIQPRNAFGIPVSDYSTLAVRFTSGPLTGAELKEWFGFYLYLSSFPKGGDNIPVIPDAYRTADLTRIVKTR